MESTDNSKRLIIIVASVIAIFIFLIALMIAGYCLYRYRFRKRNKPVRKQPDSELPAILNPAFVSPGEGGEANDPGYEVPRDITYAKLDSSRRVPADHNNYQGLLNNTVKPHPPVISGEDNVQLTTERDAECQSKQPAIPNPAFISPGEGDKENYSGYETPYDPEKLYTSLNFCRSETKEKDHTYEEIP